jgi:hypothetical protein
MTYPISKASRFIQRLLIGLDCMLGRSKSGDYGGHVRYVGVRMDFELQLTLQALSFHVGVFSECGFSSQ